MSSFLCRCIILLTSAWLLGPAVGWPQNANDGYDPNANGAVLALAVQPDGKALVVGSFTSIAGVTRTRLARLLVDGTTDPGFASVAVDGPVRSVAIQADGGIVIGGDFSQVGALVRNRIARLNANGSVDAGFNPNANGIVRALAVQADGRIVIGGQFTTLAGGATPRNHMARLNADGSVDAGFNPDANGTVFALELQPDGKILLGGLFTTLAGGATPRNYIARLHADGSVDAAFNPNANFWVNELALQADGKILLGGSFTSLGGGATPRNYIARLNGNGSVDAAFNPNADGPVNAIVVQPDGKVLLGGLFGTLSGGGTVRNHIARIDIDGSVDATFNPNANGWVRALAVQADGKVLLGGEFTTLNGGATPRNRVARLNADGSVDAAFNPDASGVVRALAVQRDGKILLGGEFTSLAGGATPRNRIARLNTNGGVDTAFNPNANGTVLAFAVQPDGKILLGGLFTTLSGGATPRNYIARLHADGSVDAAFNPDANNYVSTLAVQPDGKILLSGLFTTLDAGATPRNRIARLNADGSVDTAFNPNANFEVTGLALQPDGKILIGGSFTTLAGGATPRNHIARLNADGSIDAAFDPDANGLVRAFAVELDGKILLGGDFTTLAGGATPRSRIARLNADGSVDAAFNPDANGTAYAFAVQQDGKVLLGGAFVSLTGGATPRSRIARLSTAQAALQSLTANGSAVTWLRSGAGPELALPPTLEFSLGGAVYAPIGTLSRVPGGWSGGGLIQPLGQNYFLRVRATVGSVRGSGLIERVVQFFGSDSIFAHGFE